MTSKPSNVMDKHLNTCEMYTNTTCHHICLSLDKLLQYRLEKGNSPIHKNSEWRKARTLQPSSESTEHVFTLESCLSSTALHWLAQQFLAAYTVTWLWCSHTTKCVRLKLLAALFSFQHQLSADIQTSEKISTFHLNMSLQTRLLIDILDNNWISKGL